MNVARLLADVGAQRQERVAAQRQRMDGTVRRQACRDQTLTIGGDREVGRFVADPNAKRASDGSTTD